MTQLIEHATVGLRLAMICFAAVAIFDCWSPNAPADYIEKLRRWMKLSIVAACLIYSPINAAGLAGFTVPRWVISTAMFLTVSLGTTTLILLAAIRSLQSGFTVPRVRRAMRSDFALVFIAAAAATMLPSSWF